MSVDVLKCYRLDGADGGEWPNDHPLQPGDIVRINLNEGTRLIRDVWNEQTSDWVSARWSEVPDPSLGVADVI